MKKELFVLLFVLFSCSVYAFDCDVQTELETALNSFNFESVVPNPAMEDVQIPLLGQYDLMIENWNYGTLIFTLTNFSGGQELVLVLPQITADIRFVRTCSWSFSCSGPDQIQGSISMDSIVFRADLVGVDSVSVINSNINVNNIDVSLEGAFTSILMNILFDFIGNNIVSDLETILKQEVENIIMGFCNNNNNEVPEFSGIGVFAALVGTGIFIFRKRYN